MTMKIKLYKNVKFLSLKNLAYLKDQFIYMPNFIMGILCHNYKSNLIYFWKLMWNK